MTSDAQTAARFGLSLPVGFDVQGLGNQAAQ